MGVREGESVEQEEKAVAERMISMIPLFVVRQGLTSRLDASSDELVEEVVVRSAAGHDISIRTRTLERLGAHAREGGSEDRDRDGESSEEGHGEGLHCVEWMLCVSRMFDWICICVCAVFELELLLKNEGYGSRKSFSLYIFEDLQVRLDWREARHESRRDQCDSTSDADMLPYLLCLHHHRSGLLCETTVSYHTTTAISAPSPTPEKHENSLRPPARKESYLILCVRKVAPRTLPSHFLISDTAN